MPSQAYNDAVGAKQRRTSGKIVFEIVDNTAQDDATITASSEETNISRSADVVNNTIIDDTNKRWTSLEDGYFVLDGNNRVTPKLTDVVDVDVGYWSGAISDSNKEFDSPISLTFTFGTIHSSLGCTLVFDNDYPTAFDILFYYNNTLLAEENVTNNSDTTYVYDSNVDNYNKVVIVFNATKNANRRVRLYEAIFGVTKIFGDDELITLDITRELNLIDEVVPSSELSFSIDNIDKRFNVLNPSGLYKYLQNKQLIKSFLGVYIDDNTVEYINTGQYYLDNWESDGITASFTARDGLYFIPDNISYAVNSTTSKTLKAWLETLLELADIDDYNIDNSLNYITVATRFSSTSVKSLIKSVCTAGNCIIYVNTENIVQITKIPNSVSNSIEADNMYKFPKVQLDLAYNTVQVGIYSANGAEVQSYISVNNITNSEPAVVYELNDNPFITTQELATSVANYYLGILSRRELYNIDWRQNPALDINNVVAVEDNFNVNGDVIITKQSYNYAGYLLGRTEGRGINVANS